MGKVVENLNSCILLAANLCAPVSFTSIFDSEDLTDSGINFDSHITLLYARNLEIYPSEVMKACEKIIEKKGIFGRGNSLSEFLKNQSNQDPKPVFSMFDLSSFRNDSDYIVLKLKKETGLFKILEILNKGLQETFGVKSDFVTYTPHLTLAELVPGTADKYEKMKTLQLVLENSVISFEDLVLSIGKSGEDDFSVSNITTNKAADRFFRIRDLKSEGE